MLPKTELPKIAAFVPDMTHIDILQVVAGKPSCTISHVVHQLLPTHSESKVRTGVRQLLARRYLDFGKSTSGIELSLTSNGRVTLQHSAD
ncbi:MAG: hypothetical protein LUQ32_00675 [Methanomicrobiales archaeon]|nr:hypothetical protein [Methanomicrobiales archaeon]